MIAHLEISDSLKRDKIDLKRDYVLMGSEVWCGKTYAMPFDADPRAVYYNKTLLKQSGAKDPWDDLKGQWTFQDMEEMMQKTFKVQGNNGTEMCARWARGESASGGRGELAGARVAPRSPRAAGAHHRALCARTTRRRRSPPVAICSPSGESHLSP